MRQVVTSSRYGVDVGAHVFPTNKYALLIDRLLADGTLSPTEVVDPDPADEDELRRVHTPGYVSRCLSGKLSATEIAQLELPWSPALLEASMRCVRGTSMAARLALEHGVGIHIGGGFHHAFPDHGEGFCVFNDPACAVRTLLAEDRIERAIPIDCDVHQGNGTAAIFANDPAVATFSIHQQDIYPFYKPPSTVDVGLGSGTGDEQYSRELSSSLIPLIATHQPELAIYVAGADPYVEDQLGSLALSIDGLRHRDELVLGACEQHQIPVAVVLAGGYARRVEDTVTIHGNTVRAAARLWA